MFNILKVKKYSKEEEECNINFKWILGLMMNDGSHIPTQLGHFMST